MSILAFYTEVRHHVRASDLDDMIRAEYPALSDFSFVVDQGALENTIRVVRGPLHAIYQEKVDLVREGRVGPERRERCFTGALLHDLCLQGKIPEGKYVIKASVR